jgi:thiaminase/transcriptional activator TenA
MTFTDSLWSDIAGIRAAIGEHPFVKGLGDGSLPKDVFDGYLAQDGLYLAYYARALAGLATLASDASDTVFWATGARESILVERALHETHVAGFNVEPSPTCRGYTSYLLSLIAGGDYAEAAAGVLPCYWVYQDVGDELLAAAGSLDDHTYGDWIGVYSDESFATQVVQARGIVDRLAASAGDAGRARMRTAFVTASRYEWMFWDAAWRQETWPV